MLNAFEPGLGLTTYVRVEGCLGDGPMRGRWEDAVEPGMFEGVPRRHEWAAIKLLRVEVVLDPLRRVDGLR